MVIQLHCPKCNCVLKVQDEMAGRKGKCPKCGATFLMPASIANRALGSKTPDQAPRSLSPASGPSRASSEPRESVLSDDVGASTDARQTATRVGGKKRQWALIGAGILALVVIGSAVSCSDGKSSSMTFEEFKAKVQQALESGDPTVVTQRCEKCWQTPGKETKTVTEEYTCPKCKGGNKNKKGQTQCKVTCVMCDETGKVTDRGKEQVCDTCEGRGWARLDVCYDCHGTGKLTKTSQVTVTCSQCHGKSEWQEQTTAHPTVSQFISVLGTPSKKQEIGGNTYWYYRCRDGLVQLSVYVVDGHVWAAGDANLY